jgi:hypothetical protein
MCPESTPNPADAGCNSQFAQVLQNSRPHRYAKRCGRGHHSAWPDSRTRTTTRTRTKRLVRAPEQDSELARCICDNPGFERDVWRGNTRGVRTTLSAAPSGRIFLEPYPGLKPWAILLCHFVATGRIAHSPIRRVVVSPIRLIAHSPPCVPESRDRSLRTLRVTPRPLGLRWRQKQPRHLG